MLSAAAQLGRSLDEIIDYSEEQYRLRGFFDSLFRRSGMSVEAAMCCGDGVVATDHELRLLDEEQAISLLRATIEEACQRDNVLIVGRGGQAILQGQPGVLHVRIVALFEQRVANLQASQGCSGPQARRAIEEQDRATAQYLQRFHHVDPDDPQLYHLILNTAKLGVGACVGLMRAGIRAISPVAA
jgi:cytidylate kinase